jgi:hypothetical protein
MADKHDLEEGKTKEGPTLEEFTKKIHDALPKTPLSKPREAKPEDHEVAQCHEKNNQVICENKAGQKAR